MQDTLQIQLCRSRYRCDEIWHTLCLQRVWMPSSVYSHGDCRGMLRIMVAACARFRLLTTQMSRVEFHLRAVLLLQVLGLAIFAALAAFAFTAAFPLLHSSHTAASRQGLQAQLNAESAGSERWLQMSSLAPPHCWADLCQSSAL